MASTMRQGAHTDSTPRADQVSSVKSPSNAAATASTHQLPIYTSSSSPKVTNPRTSTNLPPYRTNPRFKLTLPPPPNAAEVFGNSFQVQGREETDDSTRDGDVVEEGQWYWYEGKRVYVRGARRRVPSNEIEDSSLCEDQDVEMEIGDEEYDCGYAMDLGAESPSPSLRSISGSPGLGSRSSSSSFLSYSTSTSTSSLSLPSSVPDQASILPESMSRKPGGAGAVYQREVEGPSEADERLMREWAVAAGVASTPVSPSIGRRSRGASVSAAYPPATGVKSISRGGSKSARWDEADRDCGICFEYAVRPARTACCGKVFCQEHLEDWLKGPNASGLCPNCDAECLLERDIMSLAAPKMSAVKPKATKSLTGGGRSSGPANTSTRRVVPSSPSSGLGLGLDQPSVSKSSSSFEPLSPSSPNTTSFNTTYSTSTSSSTPTLTRTKSNLNVAQQALLSPPSRSRTVSRSLTPGQLSPRSLFTSQQQYERLLAQEHRPSSPLSTNIPIVNPFDPAAIVGGIRRSVEALGLTTDAREHAPQVQFPSSEKAGAFPSEVNDADSDSEKGYAGNGKETEMWNGVGKDSKKRVSRSEAEYAHAVRHAASLLGCLVVLYLVVR